MSDFLARLAQRSLGTALLIAPRLPSLFAPPEEPNIGDADAAAVISTPQEIMIAPASALSRAATHAALVNIEPPVHSPQRPAVPEAAIEPRAAKRSERAEPHVEPTPTPLVQHIQPNTPAAPQPAPASSFAAPAEPRAEPGNQHRRDAPQPWRPLLPQREAAAALPAVADGHRAAEAAAPAAPTVHITIGRVEVRANITTPPAAPRARPASKPTLSLGDYLKRGGGAS